MIGLRLALVGAVALSSPGSAAQSVRHVDPFERASERGEHALRVDPLDRCGLSARCSLVRSNGELAWERVLEPSPLDAVVLDDGTVAAYAARRLWILAPEGRARMERALAARELVVHGPLVPSGVGVLAHAEHGWVGFFVRSSRVELEVHDYQSGERIAALDLVRELGLSLRPVPIETRVLPGTPFVLTHWKEDVSGGDEALALVDPLATDPAQRVAWKLSPPRAGIRVLSAERPGRFELRFPSQARCADFDASPSLEHASGWKVREVATRPWWEPVPAEPVAEPEPVELRELGRPRLQLAGKASPDGIADAFFDPSTGRWFLLRFEPYAAFVLAETGELLHVFEPSAAELGDYRSGYGQLALRPDGALLLNLGWSLHDTPHHALFRADGERLGTVRFDVNRVESVHYQPGGERVWVVGDDELFLLSGVGELLREVRKRPDGRWLGTVRGAAQASDGSLLVSDVRDDLDSSVWLLFTPDGECTAQLERPPFHDWSAFDGEWLVERGVGGVRMRRLEDERVFRLTVDPEDLEGVHTFRPFLDRPGELNLLGSDSLVVVRYAWPPELETAEEER